MHVFRLAVSLLLITAPFVLAQDDSSEPIDAVPSPHSGTAILSNERPDSKPSDSATDGADEDKPKAEKPRKTTFKEERFEKLFSTRNRKPRLPPPKFNLKPKPTLPSFFKSAPNVKPLSESDEPTARPSSVSVTSRPKKPSNGRLPTPTTTTTTVSPSIARARARNGSSSVSKPNDHHSNNVHKSGHNESAESSRKRFTSGRNRNSSARSRTSGTAWSNQTHNATELIISWTKSLWPNHQNASPFNASDVTTPPSYTITNSFYINWFHIISFFPSWLISCNFCVHSTSCNFIWNKIKFNQFHRSSALKNFFLCLSFSCLHFFCLIFTQSAFAQTFWLRMLKKEKKCDAATGDIVRWVCPKRGSKREREWRYEDEKKRGARTKAHVKPIRHVRSWWPVDSNRLRLVVVVVLNDDRHSRCFRFVSRLACVSAFCFDAKQPNVALKFRCSQLLLLFWLYASIAVRASPGQPRHHLGYSSCSTPTRTIEPLFCSSVIQKSNEQVSAKIVKTSRKRLIFSVCSLSVALFDRSTNGTPLLCFANKVRLLKRARMPLKPAARLPRQFAEAATSAHLFLFRSPHKSHLATVRSLCVELGRTDFSGQNGSRQRTMLNSRWWSFPAFESIRFPFQARKSHDYPTGGPSWIAKKEQIKKSAPGFVPKLEVNQVERVDSEKRPN